MAIATAQDVENRWVRELSEEETTLVNTRLADAERMIKRRIKDLDAKITAGDIDAEDVKQVEADMVLRLLRNPEGFTQETDGNYTYMLHQQLASGKLEVLDEEWEALGIRRFGMFVLYPQIVRPT
ncbi:head-to-tail adaptor [Mycobacterium phage Panamaxus]|uniref:Head-to-tail adaptor n=1 Tax=Mycobacterium phage Veracruz TaxID=2530154 RepID=A0A481VSR9_9CAUD|nr:head-tail adaptor Ad1 [Mycobacterium phage Veracruz]AIS73691.1 head-to-tail adaptor [Mycobacterium phage QuinnKiro]ALA11820.1 head-to-tail adaptor [Mycobacterium phage Texage]AOT24167.1 head-to-tail adaptor [Mycobacterium phage Todacoro]AOT25520.1 head-to-tail adaptor [Mycobacterium phage Margo]AUX82314.1 head-to-tail adaptor [Mycobacterium phage Lambert1]AVP42942.1 head-to-tail adaptor [Mycobacterium phage Panamaxus]AWY03549.1 head-to-tail adaptor [Mycobacterium phage Hookmount]AYR03397